MVISGGGFDTRAEAAIAELISLGGAGPEIVEFASRRHPPPRAGAGAVRIGVHRSGPRPDDDLEPFDILLSVDPAAPAPWVSLEMDGLEAALSALQAQIARQPAAATIAAQVLRTTLALEFGQALVLESLGYSLLLASEGFHAWRVATPARIRPEPPRPRVLIEEAGGALSIRLNRPDRRNAFDAAMRDALVEALGFALDHPDVPPVILSGEGPAFSAGGDLDEFGQADDPGRAHLIRVLRSPARLVRALGQRVTVRLHGACVGAGIEVPAAAARVVAWAGTVFRLPEVSMGLIPGAGGTATVPRRIGRHRACYMALSGTTIDLDTALAWGLVDAEEPA